jgi:hypothetical protein
MTVVDETVRVAVLLIPLAVLGYVWVLVPIYLTRRSRWSAVPGTFAILGMLTGLVFLFWSADAADANPSGGAEGTLGTEVPGMLIPPLILGTVALVTTKRRGRLDP